MLKKTMYALVVTLLPVVSCAYAQHAHVHGTAQMAVAVDGNMLQIDFDSPLDNLIGFEHAPRNEKERQAWQAMMDKLNKPQRLFVPSAAARCIAQSPEITLPFAEASTRASDSHADVEATFSFRCEVPAALKDIEVKVFDAFPGLHKVNVQSATPRGQSGAVLSPRQNKLAW